MVVLGIILILLGFSTCKSCYNNLKYGVAGYYSKWPYFIGPLTFIAGFIILLSNV